MVLLLALVLFYHVLFYTPKEQMGIENRQHEILLNQRKILRILCVHTFTNMDQLRECEEPVPPEKR